MENPYIPPQSEVMYIPGVRAAADGKRKLYTPGQVGWACWLGSALPGIYMVYCNFLALGKPDDAKKYALMGLGVTVVLYTVIFMLPKGFGGVGVSVGMAVAAQRFVQDKQLKRDDIAASAEYCMESNWRTTGIALLGMAVLLLTLFVGMFLFLLGKHFLMHHVA